MTKVEQRRAMKKEGLSKDQQEYAFVLLNMGRSLEQAIEEAKE